MTTGHVRACAFATIGACAAAGGVDRCRGDSRRTNDYANEAVRAAALHPAPDDSADPNGEPEPWRGHGPPCPGRHRPGQPFVDGNDDCGTRLPG